VLQALAALDAAALRSLGVQVRAVPDNDSMAAMRILFGVTAAPPDVASTAAGSAAAV
jgi:hypothetical protein